jgi:hypothetical protein
LESRAVLTMRSTSQFFQYEIAYAGNKTFNVSMTDLSGNQRWLHQSTAMTYQPNDIWVGLETTATVYSITHADPDNFERTQWQSQSGVWSYVATGGTPPTGNNAGTAIWT